MQQSVNIDTLIELIRNAKSSNNYTDHTFLLLYPSIEQYLDFIKLLYKYCKVTEPNDDQIPTPLPDLLNYTYIRSSLHTQPQSDCFEVYTIVGNVKESSIFLMDTLKSRATTINLILFEDCKSSDFTVAINSFILDDSESIKTYIKEKVIPLIETRLNQFISSFDEHKWKSATILFSNVTQWTYNSMTVPIVDFIQQYIRRLLLESNIPCQLIYLPSTIKKNEEKVIMRCRQLFEAKSLKAPQDQEISYNDVHIVAAFDSVPKIQLLDDSFLWSEWNS